MFKNKSLPSPHYFALDLLYKKQKTAASLLLFCLVTKQTLLAKWQLYRDLLGYGAPPFFLTGRLFADRYRY